MQDLERLCRGKGIRLNFEGRVQFGCAEDTLVEEQYEKDIPRYAKGAIGGSPWLERRVWKVELGVGGELRLKKISKKALKAR